MKRAGIILKKWMIVLLAIIVPIAAISAFLLTDFDGDGLSNVKEIQLKTALGNPDTDHDDLKDGVEVTEFKTDPKSSDTDDDGLGDKIEVDGWNIQVCFGVGEERSKQVDVSSDPTLGDTDGDGLEDLEEWTHGMNPDKADSDKDGLDDFEEINKFETSPTDADTDSDGLSDSEEIRQLNTNPIFWDTDKDSLGDGVEVSLPRADPLARDIFVEVDWTETSQPLPNSAKTNLERVFDEAPIENPDGSRGIDLHIDIGNQVPTNADSVKVKNETGPLNDLQDFNNRFFAPEHENIYHYALLVRFVEGKLGGITVSADFMVSTFYKFSDGTTFPLPDKSIGTSFMHELGHSLGLARGDFEGIDSKNYPYEEYPSVMNYNAMKDKMKVGKGARTIYYIYGCGTYEYSTSGTFNDWAHLAEGFDTL